MMIYLDFIWLLLLIFVPYKDTTAETDSKSKTCENNDQSCLSSTLLHSTTNLTTKTTSYEPIGYLPIDLTDNNSKSENSSVLFELFSNRIPQQLSRSESYLMSNRNKQSIRIAVFNSFDFHFEMFGYIIYYAMYYNYQVTVYTNLNDKFDWIHFYNEYFRMNNNSQSDTISNQLSWKNYSLYESERHEYDVTIIPTDDDAGFKDEWTDSKTIAIDHLPLQRKPSVPNHITVRPMRYTDDPNVPVTLQTDRRNIKFWPLPWALPCFPIISWEEKEYILRYEVDPGIINVAIIGGYQYYYNKINRLRASSPATSKIVLYLFSRGDDRVFKDKDKFGAHLTVHMHHSVKTAFLHSVLRKCHYIFTDNSPPGKFQEQGFGMSGSVPLSFAYLAPLILSRYNNGYYRFKSAFEFDINAKDSVRIVLNATKVILKLQALSKERSKLVSMFHRYMDSILFPNRTSMSTH